MKSELENNIEDIPLMFASASVSSGLHIHLFEYECMETSIVIFWRLRERFVRWHHLNSAVATWIRPTMTQESQSTCRARNEGQRKFTNVTEDRKRKTQGLVLS